MASDRVAVLGAGITGSLLAIMLAERGRSVTLFDAAPMPMARASRWNEGKIHLGYLYAGDRSRATAKRLLEGGLAFRPIMERVLGTSITEAATDHDDLFLVHRESIANVDDVAGYFDWLGGFGSEHPRAAEYLVDLRGVRPRRLTQTEIEQHADPERIVGGFWVPERSVSTRRIADLLVNHLAAEPGVTLAMNHKVLAAGARDNSTEGPFEIRTNKGPHGDFAMVLNALWEGRLAIDRGLGLQLPPEWSNRYRLAMFGSARSEVELPSTTICVGPFGDFKNYDGRNFYLSWYPAGLRRETSAVAPRSPPLPGPEARASIIDETFTRLGEILRGIAALRDSLDTIEVNGGWVYAAATGSLGKRDSTIHRRDDIGVRRSGNYFSIDTGKYSMAPLLAQTIADLVAPQA
jgi:hypothetical protein